MSDAKPVQLTMTNLVFRGNRVWIEGDPSRAEAFATLVMEKHLDFAGWTREATYEIDQENAAYIAKLLSRIDELESGQAGSYDRIAADQKILDNQRKQIREHVDTEAFLRGTTTALNQHIEELKSQLQTVHTCVHGLDYFKKGHAQYERASS
jgi:hypothetical protein